MFKKNVFIHKNMPMYSCIGCCVFLCYTNSNFVSNLPFVFTNYYYHIGTYVVTTPFRLKKIAQIYLNLYSHVYCTNNIDISYTRVTQLQIQTVQLQYFIFHTKYFYLFIYLSFFLHNNVNNASFITKTLFKIHSEQLNINSSKVLGINNRNKYNIPFLTFILK